jgi:hypothetical protein
VQINNEILESFLDTLETFESYEDKIRFLRFFFVELEETLDVVEAFETAENMTDDPVEELDFDNEE